MVEAWIVRRWLFLWYIWISHQRLDQTHIKQRSLAKQEQNKYVNRSHLSCLHCGYSRKAVKIRLLQWMEMGEATAGEGGDKVVFHFCSGGACPPQTITMLLHYHGNSIGAWDGKEHGFCSILESRCLPPSLFLIGWWRGERTEDSGEWNYLLLLSLTLWPQKRRTFLTLDSQMSCSDFTPTCPDNSSLHNPFTKATYFW